MPGYVETTQQLVTEIFVRDIHSSVQFYRRLGFEVFRENGTFAVLTWENHRLFLDQREDLPARTWRKDIPLRHQSPRVARPRRASPARVQSA